MIFNLVINQLNLKASFDWFYGFLSVIVALII